MSEPTIDAVGLNLTGLPDGRIDLLAASSRSSATMAATMSS